MGYVWSGFSLNMLRCIQDSMSLRQLFGPSTDPWGTLHSNRIGSDTSPSIQAVSYLSVKYDITQESGLSEILTQCSRRCSNVQLSMVSNAADKSSKMSTETQP